MTDEQIHDEERPVMRGLLLAAVLAVVGLGALAMLVLAAAAVVYR
jgi:hypothetical protein